MIHICLPIRSPLTLCGLSVEKVSTTHEPAFSTCDACREAISGVRPPGHEGTHAALDVPEATIEEHGYGHGV